MVSNRMKAAGLTSARSARSSPFQPKSLRPVRHCSGVIGTGAAVVTESDRRAPLELELPLTDERRYGDTLIRIHGP